MCKLKQLKMKKKSKEVGCSKNILKTSQYKTFVLFFLCVNDNQNVHIQHAQIMLYILCYNGPIKASNPRTQV